MQQVCHLNSNFVSNNDYINKVINDNFVMLKKAKMCSFYCNRTIRGSAEESDLVADGGRCGPSSNR